MAESEYNYEQEIAYTQRIRKEIIQKKIEGGIPNDNDEIKVLLSALKDHDTTTLTDRKNRIDESTSKSSAEIANAFAQFVMMQNNNNPFERNPDGTILTEQTEDEETPTAAIPQVDEARLGEFDLVDGEEEIGVIIEDSESFFERMLPKKSDD